MLEFTLDDGTSFYIIDKPRHIIACLADKPSKTIRLLTKQFPQLEMKIARRKLI